jgi:hypothetical protein
VLTHSGKGNRRGCPYQSTPINRNAFTFSAMCTTIGQQWSINLDYPVYAITVECHPERSEGSSSSRHAVEEMNR